MSQHLIQIQSPKIGTVNVSVGYDPMLDEAFLNYFNEETTYMSPPGLVVKEIQLVALRELGTHLPQQMIEGVQADVADLRTGATDLGRRVTQYEPDGTVAQV